MVKLLSGSKNKSILMMDHLKPSAVFGSCQQRAIIIDIWKASGMTV